ncbi:hypothetical protein BD408DRAFT_256979 [Parasitella parasitica]|nr:hypothetical protein BD408DRAFT_256979 [Parasitella parasitica]
MNNFNGSEYDINLQISSHLASKRLWHLVCAQCSFFIFNIYLLQTIFLLYPHTNCFESTFKI